MIASHHFRLLALASIAGLVVGCTPSGTKSVYYSVKFRDYGLNVVSVTGGESRTVIEGAHQDGLVFLPRERQLLTAEPGWVGGIMRRDLNGALVERLVENPRTHDLAYDPRRRQIYWGAKSPAAPFRYTIERIDLDDPENRVSLSGKEFDHFYSLALDPWRGKLYWTGGQSQGRLWRSRLNGSGRERIGPDFNIRQVAVDPPGARLYFNEVGVRSRGLWSSRLDGSGAAPFLSVGGASVADILVDVKARKLYWVEHATANSNPRIRRCDLKGRSVETVYEMPNRRSALSKLTLGAAPPERNQSLLQRAFAGEL